MESNLEIQKLKHSLKGKPSVDYNLTAKENLSVKTVKQGGEIPFSNEVERQRRMLIQENDKIKAKCRAQELLINSGTQAQM